MKIAYKESSEALDRMFQKGGHAGFSLRRGSFIHVKGEAPLKLSEPMSDAEWEAHCAANGHARRPDVICLGHDKSEEF